MKPEKKVQWANALPWVIWAVLAWLLWQIRALVLQQPTNLTDWLLVYLTAVYALLTLYLALVAMKSTTAAERSAKAMEDSVGEARAARFAQFGATLGFPDGYTYHRHPDASAVLRLTNTFDQPIVNLRVAMWQTEVGSSGEREVAFSTMAESAPYAINATQKDIFVVLRASVLPESERRVAGEQALEQFRKFFPRQPQHTLCLIVYNDRAAVYAPMVFVFDLEAQEVRPAQSTQSSPPEVQAPPAPDRGPSALRALGATGPRG